jgi:hypothetical protein
MIQFQTVIGLVLASTLILKAGIAAADTIYVAPATGSGVNQSDLATTTDLIKTSVNHNGSHQIVNQADQADFTLQPNLLNLGSAYVLQLSKIKSDGAPVFSTQLKAERLDELDKVADRVTHAVLAGKAASQDTQVGEITNQEAHDGTQRRPARNEWYAGFGGSGLSGLNVSGLGYSLGLARAWDLNTALLKIMFEDAGLDSSFLMSTNLGGQYFLSNSDLAPYLGADFGFGAAKAEGGGGFFSGQTVGGFDVGGEAGAELLRTAAINLDLMFRASFLLHSTSYGMPIAYTLRLGLYF